MFFRNVHRIEEVLQYLYIIILLQQDVVPFRFATIIRSTPISPFGIISTLFAYHDDAVYLENFAREHTLQVNFPHVNWRSTVTKFPTKNYTRKQVPRNDGTSRAYCQTKIRVDRHRRRCDLCGYYTWHVQAIRVTSSDSFSRGIISSRRVSFVFKCLKQNYKAFGCLVNFFIFLYFERSKRHFCGFRVHLRVCVRVFRFTHSGR